MKFTRNRVFGLIGAVWGGAAVVRGVFFKTIVTDNPAYARGQISSLIFAGVMCLVGIYYFYKG